MSWVALKFGGKGTALQRLGEGFFVAAFIATRILTLPVVVYALTVPRWAECEAALGAGLARVCAGTLWVIVALQFYWLQRIVSMLCCPKAGKAAGGVAGKGAGASTSAGSSAGGGGGQLPPGVTCDENGVCTLPEPPSKED